MPSKPIKIQRAYMPAVKPFERTNSNYSFYNSWTWRKVSKLFLKENPLCLHCQANGIDTPAKVTDHITPINKGGDKFNENNFQALCESCHNKKSSSEASRGDRG